MKDGKAAGQFIVFADALARVAPPVPPAPAPYRRPDGRGPETGRRGPDTAQMAGYGGQRPPPRPESRGRGHHGPPERPGGGYRHGGDRPRRSATAKAMISVVAVLVLAAVTAIVWSFSNSSGHGTAQAGGHSQPPSPSTASSVVLKPVQANGFDPLSNSDPGNEDDAGAMYAIDSNPTSFWHTQYYQGNPAFGGLKKGSGLILDMGTQVRLSQLQVQFGSVCCATVHIEIGNDNTRSPATIGTFTTVASSSSAVNGTTFHVTSSAKGRYVLIWFTSLPAMAGNSSQFMAQVYNVTVRGSS